MSSKEVGMKVQQSLSAFLQQSPALTTAQKESLATVASGLSADDLCTG
jgi:DNA-binding CsgD family transcriptional regulator